MRRLLSVKNMQLYIGGLFLLSFVLLAIFGPLLLSRDPYEMQVTLRLNAPTGANLFGTDEFGRDLLTRIVYGARVSLLVGFVVTMISGGIGLILGLYSSYYKALDHVIMRICDGLIAIPGVLLAIALMASLGPAVENVIIALSIVFTPNIARIIRSSALRVKEEDYIDAIRAVGASDTRIIWKHIMPNVLSPLLVQMTFVFAEAIISEAALSFLGVGIPVEDPSWGNILQSGRLVVYQAWWMIVAPSAFIFITVLSLNLVGDGLRDQLDPKFRKKFKKRSRLFKTA